MKRSQFACMLVLAAASTACFGLDNLFNSPTSSSDSSTSTTRSYLGTWTGPTLTSFPTTQSCGSMQWKITSQTGSQISGDFTGSCSGGMTLVGTLVATIADSTAIPWAASGTATQGLVSCPFTMTGTGTFSGTSNITVNYAGTACGTPIGGSETIKRS